MSRTPRSKSAYELVERSSLGSREAREKRYSVPAATGRSLVERANELGQARSQRRNSRTND